MEFAQQRFPINMLYKNEIGTVSEYIEIFSKKFSMYCPLKFNSYESVVNYAFFEHMLRPTMLKEERNTALSSLSAGTQLKIKQCLETSDVNPFSMLAGLISQETKEPLMKVIVKMYTLEPSLIKFEQIVPDGEYPLPICYVLRKDTKFYLLYSTHTTFIDGYDANTGQYKKSVIPALLVKKARNFLYANSPRTCKKRNIQISSILEESEHSSDQEVNSKDEGKLMTESKIEEASRIHIQNLQGKNPKDSRGCCSHNCLTF